MRLYNTVLLTIALGLSVGAMAQAPAKLIPRLAGQTTDGQPFQLADLRGKVVMVMFWSTDCSVCRDKMPELRKNYAGWRGQPFELVVVSTDRRRADLDSYERIVSATVPLSQRFVQLWQGEPDYSDSFVKSTALPLTFLIDKSGAIVAEYSGRVPLEAWNRVADLL